MLKFLLKRIGVALIVLFGVSVTVFTLIHMQPGNPYLNMIDPNLGPEVIEQKLRALGYYDPIYIQYLKLFLLLVQYIKKAEKSIIESLKRLIIHSYTTKVI